MRFKKIMLLVMFGAISCCGKDPRMEEIRASYCESISYEDENNCLDLEVERYGNSRHLINFCNNNDEICEGNQ
jgi:hypothetical protein